MPESNLGASCPERGAGDAPADDASTLLVQRIDQRLNAAGAYGRYGLAGGLDLAIADLEEARQLLAAARADREDAERWRWYAANADRWKLGYVALRGKWYCEGPDDALLDERFASAEEAIDAARRSQGGEHGK